MHGCRGMCMVAGRACMAAVGGACVVVGVCMVVGGMHDWGACMVVGGGAWLQGGHAWRGVCMAGGHAWPGGIHGERGACVARGREGMCGEGGCMVNGGMCGRGGHAWQRGEACVVCRPPLRDTAGQCVDGTHPTGMHSCCILMCIYT